MKYLQRIRLIIYHFEKKGEMEQSREVRWRRIRIRGKQSYSIPRLYRDWLRMETICWRHRSCEGRILKIFLRKVNHSQRYSLIDYWEFS
jgi:hypothetical protein